MLCRHATKIIKHHSKAEQISKLTAHSQLFACKNLYFVNYEVMAGCPKLGHTTLACLRLEYRWITIEHTTNAHFKRAQGNPCAGHPSYGHLHTVRLGFSTFRKARNFAKFRRWKINGIWDFCLSKCLTFCLIITITRFNFAKIYEIQPWKTKNLVSELSNGNHKSWGGYCTNIYCQYRSLPMKLCCVHCRLYP